MPAGWRDTVNALQRLTYDCRDSVLIVDDLKTQEQIAAAEGLMQAQGNLQNRARMNVDQSLQKPLNPRGALLSTGEIDPRTRSTLGRIVMIEIESGDVDLGVLTRLQEVGDGGGFARTMAPYIQWLAPQLDAVRDEHRGLTDKIREEIGDIAGAHPRHSDIIAQLLAAYQLFLRFVVESGAVDQTTADHYQDKARQILLELGAAQGEIQDESRPGRRFLELIASALRSLRCHLLRANSDWAPSRYAGACGWHKDWLYQGTEIGQTLEWKIPVNSKCVGFIDEEAGFVYLDPGETQAIAQETAKRQGDPQSFASVGRELLNEGLCVPHFEDGKRRASGHKRFEVHGNKRYIWVPIQHIFGPPELVDEDQIVPTVPTSFDEENSKWEQGYDNITLYQKMR
jgi:hypothetical protein